MVVDLCIAHMFMLFSMTLALMQGHSMSAEGKHLHDLTTQFTFEKPIFVSYEIIESVKNKDFLSTFITNRDWIILLILWMICFNTNYSDLIDRKKEYFNVDSLNVLFEEISWTSSSTI